MRIFLSTFGIVLVDQLIKQLVLRWFDLPFWLIDQQLGLQVVFNRGVAFSLPVTGFMSILVSSAVISGLLYYYLKFTKRTSLADCTFALILGGALGNFLDRLHSGAVIDYVHIFSYPAFNVADIAITVGFLIFVFRFDNIRI